jgi:hypothetical protein
MCDKICKNCKWCKQLNAYRERFKDEDVYNEEYVRYNKNPFKDVIMPPSNTCFKVCLIYSCCYLPKKVEKEEDDFCSKFEEKNV